MAVTAGLRVSELTGLTLDDVHLGTGAHVVCRGKGRKNRVTPLDAQTVEVLRAYTAALPPGTGFVFPTRTGTRMSRDAVAARLTQHTATAGTTCPTRKHSPGIRIVMCGGVRVAVRERHAVPVLA